MVHHRLLYLFRYLPTHRLLLLTVTYATILETYSLEDILELNDLTPEDCLEFLVEEGYVDLPEIKPLDF